MNNNNDIVTLTMNPALDVYMTVPEVKPDKKLRGGEPRTEPGGGGINVSRAIAKLGGKSTAIYTHGGFIGDGFTEMLALEDIGQYPVWVKNNTRQNFVVSDNSTGNLFRFGTPGSPLDEAECRGIFEKLKGMPTARYFVASGSLPPNVPDDFYAEVAKIASDHEAKFILDTSGKPLSEILNASVYLIKPNLEELEALTGRKTESEEEQRDALKQIVNEYDIENVVLSLGKNGAMLATRSEIQHFPALKVEEKSSVGAGDSMVGGIVYFLSMGKPIEDAVLYGLACGSAAIMTPGTELLRKADAERLYEQLQVSHHPVVE